MTISQVDNFFTAPPLRLRNRHQRQLRNFLLDDLEGNLFALSWLENHGVEPHRDDHYTFWGYFDESRQLNAAALNIANRLLMLDVRRDEEAYRFARFFGAEDWQFQHVVSQSRNVTPFWRVYASDEVDNPAAARLVQHQELYRLVPEHFAAPEEPLSRVRRADLSEIDPLFLASARMHREETEEDPLRADSSAFRRHVHFRITHGRTFVWFDEHRHLLFKADVSTRCALGAQISGVYTSPRHRNQGIATRAMTDICAILFNEDMPRLTLYVNETNEAAKRVYEKIGFRFLAPFQTVFVAH